MAPVTLSWKFSANRDDHSQRAAMSQTQTREEREGESMERVSKSRSHKDRQCLNLRVLSLLQTQSCVNIILSTNSVTWFPGAVKTRRWDRCYSSQRREAGPVTDCGVHRSLETVPASARESATAHGARAWGFSQLISCLRSLPFPSAPGHQAMAQSPIGLGRTCSPWPQRWHLYQ